jgi:hypothetical protein
MSSGRRVLIAGIVAVAVAIAAPGVANADNNNNNTNTNDVTNIGNPSDMILPRDNENTSWPPEGLSWPPSDITNTGGENGRAAAAPIVMPVGGTAGAARASTSNPTKPILPVNTP